MDAGGRATHGAVAEDALARIPQLLVHLIEELRIVFR